MKIAGIQVGLPRALGSNNLRSSIMKEAVHGSVHVGKTNLAGDAQADLENHGGADKAICVYPQEHYPYWEKTLNLNFSPGDFGENFTTQEVMEADICIGDIFRIGSATVQVSQPRQPCWKLAKRWGVKKLPLHVQETGRTGWYFRVLEEGEVRANASIELIESANPEWTVARANEMMHHHQTDWSAVADLANCPGLSDNWQATLNHRVEKRTIEDSSKRLLG